MDPRLCRAVRVQRRIEALVQFFPLDRLISSARPLGRSAVRLPRRIHNSNSPQAMMGPSKSEDLELRSGVHDGEATSLVYIPPSTQPTCATAHSAGGSPVHESTGLRISSKEKAAWRKSRVGMATVYHRCESGQKIGCSRLRELPRRRTNDREMSRAGRSRTDDFVGEHEQSTTCRSHFILPTSHARQVIPS